MSVYTDIPTDRISYTRKDDERFELFSIIFGRYQLCFSNRLLETIRVPLNIVYMMIYTNKSTASPRHRFEKNLCCEWCHRCLSPGTRFALTSVCWRIQTFPVAENRFRVPTPRRHTWSLARFVKVLMIEEKKQQPSLQAVGGRAKAFVNNCCHRVR